MHLVGLQVLEHQTRLRFATGFRTTDEVRFATTFYILGLLQMDYSIVHFRFATDGLQYSTVQYCRQG